MWVMKMKMIIGRFGQIFNRNPLKNEKNIVWMPYMFHSVACSSQQQVFIELFILQRDHVASVGFAGNFGVKM